MAQTEMKLATSCCFTANEPVMMKIVVDFGGDEEVWL